MNPEEVEKAVAIFALAWKGEPKPNASDLGALGLQVAYAYQQECAANDALRAEREVLIQGGAMVERTLRRKLERAMRQQPAPRKRKSTKRLAMSFAGREGGK